GPSPFTLQVDVLGGQLAGVNLTEGGNTGPVTLLLEGGPFEPDFELRGPGGELIFAANVRVFEGGDAAAVTFDLAGAPPGQYDVVAGWGDGSSAVLPDGFSVAPGGSGQFEVGLIGPDVLRADVQMPFTLEWSNTGNVDMPVELIRLDLPPGLTAAIGPDNKKDLGEVALLSFAPGTTDYGVLPAGASGSMDLWLTSEPGFPNLDLEIGSIPIDDPSLASVPIDWDSLLPGLMPEGFDPDRLDEAIDNLTDALGETLDDVIDGLTDNAVVDFLGDAVDEGEAALDRLDDAIQAGQSMLGNLLGDAMARAYPTPKPGDKGDGVHQDFVFIIAVEDFWNWRQQGGGAADLPGTQEDLELLLEFYREDLNIGSKQITVLRDQAKKFTDDITFADIQAAWQKLVSKADSDDKIKVHFGGHGLGSNNPNRLGGLLMNDPTGKDIVTGAELRKMFEDHPMPGETYVVLDSCHSEAIGDALDGLSGVKWESAVAADESAADGDTFTSKWVEAHQDEDNDRDGDGRVTISEAFKSSSKAYTAAHDSLHPKTGGDKDVDQELHDDIGEATRRTFGDQILDGLNYIHRLGRWILNAFDCDPNEKVGPEGAGADNFLPEVEPFQYTIYFENDPEKASAPAQVVIVTDQLPADLDWSTFELKEVSFGDHTVELAGSATHGWAQVHVEELAVVVDIEAELDTATGLATWTLRSLDPITLGPTLDPL
ncbi:MAG: hypothetical protein ACYS5V_15275, partial [Planctomycetota bacterium]